MRTFSYILMIVLMAMQFMPCSDKVSSVRGAGSIRLETVKKSASENHKSDRCTPFCTCSCCAAQVIPQPSLKIALNISVFSPTYVDHYRENYIDISLPIWRPPQLVA
ncbi:DUF6660 family protein [Niabella beijingensis]|uniref:DUF6660 family protein n=1 Tax=Niabella beijingensis TaxID=2872700 RepID=UPI003B849734